MSNKLVELIQRSAVVKNGKRFQVGWKGKLYPVLVGLAKTAGYHGSDNELDCAHYLQLSLLEIATVQNAGDGLSSNPIRRALNERYNLLEIESFA